MFCKIDYDTLEYLRKRKLFFSSHGYVKNLKTYQKLTEPLKPIKEFKFHPQTQKNLDFLSTQLMIGWQYTFKYTAGSRKGYIIYGETIKKNNYLITYERRETSSAMSGGTIIHIKGGSLKVSEIIDRNDKKFGNIKKNNF